MYVLWHEIMRGLLQTSEKSTGFERSLTLCW